MYFIRIYDLYSYTSIYINESEHSHYHTVLVQVVLVNNYFNLYVFVHSGPNAVGVQRKP